MRSISDGVGSDNQVAVLEVAHVHRQQALWGRGGSGSTFKWQVSLPRMQVVAWRCFCDQQTAFTWTRGGQRVLLLSRCRCSMQGLGFQGGFCHYFCCRRCQVSDHSRTPDWEDCRVFTLVRHPLISTRSNWPGKTPRASSTPLRLVARARSQKYM